MHAIHSSLLNDLATGAVLITPNNRLSHHLLALYMAQQPQLCIEKPACYPYTTFIHRLYQQVRAAYPHHAHPRLISDQMTRLLWQHVLSPSCPEACNQGLLTTVMSAWTACEDWQLSPQHPEFNHKRETQQFQRWQQTFQQHLDHQHAITTEQVINYCLTHQFLPTMPALVWVCFDDYTPVQRALQTALTHRNSPQQHYDLTHIPATAQCIEAESLDDEYQQCIQWLKQKLAAGERRLGVIVPDLTTHAATIQRLFKRHFSEQQLNISFGRPLAEYTLVAHALQWLQLDVTAFTGHQIRLLLSSPYLAHAHQESSARMQLLQDNAAFNTSELALPSVLQYLHSTCPQLKLSLAQLQPLPSLAPTNTWANQFKQRLITLGFPGDGSLNSASYQCLQRWYGLLDEFHAFSLIMPQMTHAQAIAALQQLANTTLFQPQQAPDAPIHILGLLEASGCRFDSLWVMHLTDQVLPQKTHLSAFIPLNLQRELDMPHANPTREYHYAQHILHRLQQGAQETYFSYARHQDDTPYLPSPLIQHLNATRITYTPPTTDAVLITQTELYCHPVLTQEHITGGTQLLANQAKCPFKAFAAHRLHAKVPPAYTEGLSLPERGQVLHKSLELLWRQLQTQAVLLQQDTDTLAHDITTCVQQALVLINSPPRLSFPPLLQTLEIQRLSQLIQASLRQEKTRPAFTVLALEKTAQLELAGLSIQLKLDRLDACEDGKQWVIDYKSKAPDRKPWLDDRPEEPQLLLYALLDPHICGLLFMELRQGQASYLGLTDEAVELPGVKADPHWHDSKATWRSQLEALALEFQHGLCTPTPTRASTCMRCEFQMLCRIEA
jgi:probable DNA repair protein